MAVGEIVKSLDTKLYYKVGGTEFKQVLNLQSVGALGGTAESIEVTTLDDDTRLYTAGLKSFGDSIDFKALYTKEQFLELYAIEDSIEWKIEFKDGTTITFTGTCSVSVDDIAIGDMIYYTLSVKPDSKMVFA